MIYPTITGVMDPVMPVFADAVATLHTRTMDVKAGYKTMVEKAEPDFRHVPEAFLALHQKQADALTRMLVELGRSPDADGSFMGTVNQAVVSLRAVFDKIDEDVIGSIQSGEDHVLNAFEKALAIESPAPAAAELMEMRDALQRLLTQTAAQAGPRT